MQPLPYLVMAPILIWAAWTDLRHMRVSNAAVFAATVVFALSVPLIGWGEAGIRLGMAVAVFAAGFPLFVIRIVRGGDVKTAAALMLFVPAHTYALFAFHFLLTVIAGLVLARVLRLVAAAHADAPAPTRAGNRFPISLAVMATGVVHIAMLMSIR